MTLLKITRMGHPVLRRRAEAVSVPVSAAVRTLAAAMIETMKDAPGIGLAAPQVYEGLRLIVFHAPPARAGDVPLASAPLTVLLNPEIEPLSDTMAEDWEGCLSIPGLRGRVLRHDYILYRGITLDGERLEREATGLHARVVQHECDHLDGILYLDRMRDMASLTFESEWAHHQARNGESA